MKATHSPQEPQPHPPTAAPLQAEALHADHAQGDHGGAASKDRADHGTLDRQETAGAPPARRGTPRPASSTSLRKRGVAPPPSSATRGAESPDEDASPDDHFGEHKQRRIQKNATMLTAAQLNLLVATMLDQYPHHGRLLSVMTEVGLWLPVTLGLQIGDVDRTQSRARIARGWSATGVYPIPKRTGRGFIPQGELAPTLVPLSASALKTIDEQIAFLRDHRYPTEARDWLFPGEMSGHPWNPGVFSHMVLQPALRRLQLPTITPKELYFVIMRIRIEAVLQEKARVIVSQPSPACSDPGCPRRRAETPHPLNIPTPLVPEMPCPQP